MYSDMPQGNHLILPTKAGLACHTLQLETFERREIFNKIVKHFGVVNYGN